jgi:hypothetical protein
MASGAFYLAVIRGTAPVLSSSLKAATHIGKRLLSAGWLKAEWVGSINLMRAKRDPPYKERRVSDSFL